MLIEAANHIRLALVAGAAEVEADPLRTVQALIALANYGVHAAEVTPNSAWHTLSAVSIFRQIISSVLLSTNRMPEDALPIVGGAVTQAILYGSCTVLVLLSSRHFLSFSRHANFSTLNYSNRVKLSFA